ncbi:MAG: protease pro-enzyme activation domain-containing protein [Solirubrobacteraceae bacterium]
MRRTRFVLTVSIAAVCAAALIATVGSQAANASSPERATLAGTAAPSAARTHHVGSVSNTSAVNFEVVLKLRDASGAQALVQSISTPGSADYRHYLTAAQWENRFSPTTAQVNQVTAWLRSEGLSVGAVSKDRLTIAASGTASQVESAFGTSLQNYQVGGQTLRMATSDLSVPSSLSGIVEGAMGVNQNVAKAQNVGNPDVPGSSPGASGTVAKSNQFPPAPAAFLPAPPCSAYYGASSTTLNPPFGQGYPNTVPDVVCGYVPGQFRSAYGVTPAATGKGVTVAIIDAYGSSTIVQDATRYFKQNDPGNPFSKAGFKQINATPFDDQSLCGASGWLTEQAIDVEAVHATAPDAHILYYGAQDCVNGLFTAEQNVIDNRLADVVTNSWGDDAGDLLDDASTKTAYDDLFLLADATGMTVQFSSGDDGDNFDLFGFSAPDYPTDSPYVTSVGGTSLMIGSNGQRIGELGWNTGRSFFCTPNIQAALGCTIGTWTAASPDGGSGGYTSYYYAQPFYQAGVVPLPLSERNFTPPARVDPDISLDADPGTGFLIGLHQTLPDGTSQYTQTRYGGTSLASPLLAGLVADADQAAGVGVGFINPDIYRLHANPSAILDILPEPYLEGNYRQDYAGPVGLGLGSSGYAISFRQLYYSGLETYCDATGNCASRPETQSAAPGYDSLTGLGSPGTNFIGALAGH